MSERKTTKSMLKFERRGGEWTVTVEDAEGTHTYTGTDLWKTYLEAGGNAEARYEVYEVYVGSGFTEAVREFERAHAEMGHALRTLAARIDAAKAEEGFDDDLIAFITGNKTLTRLRVLIDSGVWEIGDESG